MKKITMILSLLLLSCTLKAQLWRVQSEARTTYDASMNITAADSTRYYYAPLSGHGSNKMADTIKYSSAQQYYLYKGVMTPYGDILLHRFDTLDRIIGVITRAGIDTTYETGYTYAPGGKALLASKSYTKSSGPGQSYYKTWDTYSYTFDTAQRLLEMTHGVTNVTPPYQYHETTYYIYDTSGFLVRDSAYLFAPTSPTGSVHTTMTEYDNNTLGDSVEVRRYRWSIVDTSYHLQGAVKIYEYDTQRRIVKDSSKGINSYKYNYAPNGDLATVTYTQSGGGNLATYQYGTHGKIEQITTTGQLNANSFTTIHVYHYEAHWPKSVEGVNEPEMDITLYPVPASDILHITGEFDKPGKINVTITDMSGRQLNHMQVQTGHTLNMRLPVSQLPAGNYLLSFEQEGHILTKKFVVQ